LLFVFKKPASQKLLLDPKKYFCFLRAKAASAILSVCLSVRPSVCHTGGSVKNGAS